MDSSITLIKGVSATRRQEAAFNIVVASQRIPSCIRTLYDRREG